MVLHLGFGLLFLGLGVRIGLKSYRQYILMHNPEYLTKLNKELNYPGGFLDKMSIGEAQLILGLNQNNFKKEDIYKAYIRQISINHPDRGGSIYLSTKINEARDNLINK